MNENKGEIALFIADTHSDTLYAMGVDHMPKSQLMITPERLNEGGVNLQVFALWTGRDGNRGDVSAIVNAELSAVPALAAAGLRQVNDPNDAKEGERCFMLSIEGGEPLENDLHSVEEWAARGVGMTALVWNNENRIGFPAKSGSQNGLTTYGVQVVKEMQRVGMAVDTSHLNERGFWDIFAKTNLPPLASHSCCKALCGHARNLTDEQLKALIRDGGYVGVNFYPYFLSDDGTADAERVAEHIDHICQLGGASIVGFGSDFDGIEVAPDDLNHPGELPNLIHALKRRGYSDTDIAGIAGENLRAYYRRIR